MNEITLPEGQVAGTDWNKTFQSIVAYGTGRLFDTYAVKNIYKAAQPQYLVDEYGQPYLPGQKSSQAVNTAPLGVPLLYWLIGGGLVAFLVLKD